MSQAIDDEGWLHSGDKGIKTADGMIKITGTCGEGRGACLKGWCCLRFAVVPALNGARVRMLSAHFITFLYPTQSMIDLLTDVKTSLAGRYKELLIGAGGENVAPVPIEDAVKAACPVSKRV